MLSGSLARAPQSTFLRGDRDAFQICCHEHPGGQGPKRSTDSKLDEVQGRAHVANNLSDSERSRSHGHYCACSLVLPIFRSLWHQSAEKRSEPILSLQTHSLCLHLPAHPAALPVPLGSSLGANLWKDSFT